MARQKSDPSLEGHLAENLRWLLLLIAVLMGIGGLAFMCAKPAVSETDVLRPPNNGTQAPDPLPAQDPAP